MWRQLYVTSLTHTGLPRSAAPLSCQRGETKGIRNTGGAGAAETRSSRLVTSLFKESWSMRLDAQTRSFWGEQTPSLRLTAERNQCWGFCGDKKKKLASMRLVFKPVRGNARVALMSRSSLRNRQSVVFGFLFLLLFTQLQTAPTSPAGYLASPRPRRTWCLHGTF